MNFRIGVDLGEVTHDRDNIYDAGKDADGSELVSMAARRLGEALEFVSGSRGALATRYRREKLGWALCFDTLSALEEGLRTGGDFAMSLQASARDIVQSCSLPASANLE